MTPVFGHGRLRLYLLKLLDESPRHGYELIRLLEDRFLGLYSPSAGTVYPRLAHLEREGLVTHDEEGGRKVYRLTDAGQQELRDRDAELGDVEAEIANIAASVHEVARDVGEQVRASARELKRELRDAAREVRRQQRQDRRQTWQGQRRGPEDHRSEHHGPAHRGLEDHGPEHSGPEHGPHWHAHGPHEHGPHEHEHEPHEHEPHLHAGPEHGPREHEHHKHEDHEYEAHEYGPRGFGRGTENWQAAVQQAIEQVLRGSATRGPLKDLLQDAMHGTLRESLQDLLRGASRGGGPHPSGRPPWAPPAGRGRWEGRPWESPTWGSRRRDWPGWQSDPWEESTREWAENDESAPGAAQDRVSPTDAADAQQAELLGLLDRFRAEVLAAARTQSAETGPLPSDAIAAARGILDDALARVQRSLRSTPDSGDAAGDQPAGEEPPA